MERVGRISKFNSINFNNNKFTTIATSAWWRSKNIFTQILLQGGDVEYPVVASEIPIIEPIVATTKTQPIEEKPIIPEPTVEKDNGFHLKFREPDPTELNILKKIEIAESNHKVETVLSKSVTSVQAKQNKPEEKEFQ